MNPKKILLVDDEVVAILALKDFLLHIEEFPCEVITARNGREALDTIDALPAGELDFIISDIDMPEMDGLELCREVREGGIHIAFVLVSGNSEDEDEEEKEQEALRAGADVFIPKGFASYKALEFFLRRNA